MGHRRRARECALQMLFQIDLVGGETGDVFAQFWQDKDADRDVRSFAEGLVRGVVRERRSLDALIAPSVEHWRIERMAVVDRNVLRMAVYEMLFDPDVPPPVAIDEAIEVVKKFGSQESAPFINGVLDAVRRRLAARGDAERDPERQREES